MTEPQRRRTAPGREIEYPPQPNRVIYGGELQQTSITALDLYKACINHPRGMRGVAPIIGVVPRTIIRHLRHNGPGGQHSGPKLQLRNALALGKYLNAAGFRTGSTNGDN